MTRFVILDKEKNDGDARKMEWDNQRVCKTRPLEPIHGDTPLITQGLYVRFFVDYSPIFLCKRPCVPVEELEYGFHD